MSRPARPPLPIATIAIALAIVAVFAAELAGDGIALCQLYGFVSADPTLARALTSLFAHDPASWTHVAGNLAILLLIGSRVEQAIGSTRFAGLFITGGLAGAAFHLLVDPTSMIPLVGCSGALFAILAVAAALFGPAMLSFVAVLAAAAIGNAFGGPGDASVSFACHIGGFVVGAALVVLARLRGADVHRAVAA